MELYNRAKALIFNPKNEWAVIDAEGVKPHSSVFFSYLLPLALIPAVAGFIRAKMSFDTTIGVFQAVETFAVIVGSVYLAAAIVNFLSDQFGQTKNFDRAFSLVAYSFTPLCVAGILYFFSSFAWLVPFIGAYGLYLLIAGVEHFAQPPVEKRTTCIVICLIAVLGSYFVLNKIVPEIVATVRVEMLQGQGEVDDEAASVGKGRLPNGRYESVEENKFMAPKDAIIIDGDKITFEKIGIGTTGRYKFSNRKITLYEGDQTVTFDCQYKNGSIWLSGIEFKKVTPGASSTGQKQTTPEKAPTAPEKASIALDIEMVDVPGGKTVINGKTITLGSFKIAKYELTQKLWHDVMDKRNGNNSASSSKRENSGDSLPMRNISWHSTQEFIAELNKQTGKKYRLPTEVEWEYAAKGGQKSRNYRYSGSNVLPEVAWYYDNSNGQPHPVGRLAPNELGIYDMSGNVLEWCSDWYICDNAFPYTSFNPTGPSSGYEHTIRGDSWRTSAELFNLTSRSIPRNKYNNDGIGFRLAEGEIAPDMSGQAVNIEMVDVPGGATKINGLDITLSSFKIGKYELTEGQWETVMSGNPSCCPKGKNYPVDNVSWYDVQTFIAKLNKLSGKNYRLPTETEWEYAAKGGQNSKNYKYSGSNDLGRVGKKLDFYVYGCDRYEVGKFAPNELGIYDMSGNVGEWCSDWSDSAYPYASNNPKGPATGKLKIARDGCDVTNRNSHSPNKLMQGIGFRLVLP